MFEGLRRIASMFARDLTPTPSSGSWVGLIREPFTGAWQSNKEQVSTTNALAFDALYACITLIASDIAKLPLRLVELTKDGIWAAAESPAFSPVLRKPNRAQTRIQFIQNWMMSKLTSGNTYILLERDARQVVTRMYVLDPGRVKPMIADDGAVFYALQSDRFTGVPDGELLVPASEIIHDRYCPLFHPLVGVSPIYACAMSVDQGLKIQEASKNLFAGDMRPSGVLSTKATLHKDQVKQLQESFMSHYTGANAGRIAVVTGDMSFSVMSSKAIDAQLVEQLKLSAERVCSALHVPAYKVGAGPAPTHNNGELLNQAYYSECLQIHIESIEALLDEALGLHEAKEGRRYGTEFDVDALLRMDSLTRIDVLAKGVGSALYSPDEGRQKLNLGPVPGGRYPYLQQQNYSLEALSRRDEKPAPTTEDEPEDEPPPEEAEPEDVGKAFRDAVGMSFDQHLTHQ